MHSLWGPSELRGLFRMVMIRSVADVGFMQEMDLDMMEAAVQNRKKQTLANRLNAGKPVPRRRASRGGGEPAAQKVRACRCPPAPCASASLKSTLAKSLQIVSKYNFPIFTDPHTPGLMMCLMTS